MTRRRIVLVLLLVCGLAALGSLSAQQKNASRAGWISDEACGAQHTKPGRADCVQKCWRGGASVGHPEWKPQRAVFVADEDHALCRVARFNIKPQAFQRVPAPFERLFVGAPRADLGDGTSSGIQKKEGGQAGMSVLQKESGTGRNACPTNRG